MAESMTSDHSGQDGKASIRAAGEPAEAGAFPAASRTTGQAGRFMAKPPNPRWGSWSRIGRCPRRCNRRGVFSAVLYGLVTTPTREASSGAGGDGQQERAHDHGQDAGIRGYPDARPAEYLAPCALNTTGGAKQAMRAKTAHTEAPASHAASRGVRRVP